MSIYYSSASATLFVEGLTLIELCLAFTVGYLADTAGSLPSSAIIGALFMFSAICTGIVAAIMLLINVFSGRIDIGTVIAVAPFFGFTIWGIWYSYTDIAWAQNVPIYWALLVAVAVLWLYVAVKCIRQRKM